jgi:hypothetical protein
MTKLPPPEQWALVKMTVDELAEEIERHIDYVDEHGRSVHLPTPFVRHYLRRDDGVLPTVVAIATAPIILADGDVLALAEDRSLDKLRGIRFHIPPEVMALLPKRAACTPAAVQQAMKFLTDDWLCDVLTDYTGKCVIVAAALTVIERSLLPDRPVFFVTAGRRGSGKTTLLIMLLMAITGMRPAAAAWSPNEEERRKALLSYFLYGVSYILWDNIKRGSTIRCPHIERSCTADYYVDRKLGVSETVRTAASAIHFFTGNNISPAGDLASRALNILLSADRADPENRNFAHPDPVGWTENHRAEIMAAFYTILLGNPTLDKPRTAPMHTRFKLWWRLVGSAVEHAAKQCGQNLDFRDLFREVEAEDEDDVSLAQVLAILKDEWPDTNNTEQSKWFKSNEVADIINAFDHTHQATLRAYFCPLLAEGRKASPDSIGKKLKAEAGNAVLSEKVLEVDASGNPARIERSTFLLKRRQDTAQGPKSPYLYQVTVQVEERMVGPASTSAQPSPT